MALLLKFLPLDIACEVSGVEKHYITNARTPSYNVLSSRLVTEQYTPGTTKKTVHEVEEVCTIEWMKELILGEKSGQVNADKYYRFERKDVIYHEQYQPRYVDHRDFHLFLLFRFMEIVKRMVDRLKEDGNDLALARAPTTRFWRNIAVFLKHKKRSKVYIATAKDLLDDEGVLLDDEGDAPVCVTLLDHLF